MAEFATTRWSVVRAAGAEPSRCRYALETLCGTYWRPVYAYIRSRDISTEDAKDLTREFFAHFLERGCSGDLDPSEGRFRVFLLASANRFLSGERDREPSVKRGAGAALLPFDFAEAEEHHLLCPAQTPSPEALFDRAWVLALLEATLTRLRRECAESGKEALFELLKGAMVTGEVRLDYGELALEMGMSEGTVKLAVHHMRHRHRQLVLDEIAQTLTDGESVDEELRHLFSALGTRTADGL